MAPGARRSRAGWAVGRRAAAWAAAAAVWAGAAVRAAAQTPRDMPSYDSPYYVIHSDLEPNVVREAYARLTAMAEEYHARTQGFSGAIRRKLPFYLFSKAEDYYQAGGLPGSMGVYMGDRLMAVAGSRTPGSVWHVVQHEGFHQFAHRMISSRLPMWVNEGMAEYFGQGLWTGDGLVTGVVPQARLDRVLNHIAGKQVLRFSQMLEMSNQEWNGALSRRNYDQAWSMVHFLVHGDGGKYLDAFSGYINDIARGGSVTQSFARRFGRDDEAFQRRYEQWWTSLPPNSTQDKYTEAVVATLTGFLARAHFLKMAFPEAGEFFQAGREGKIRIDGAKQPRLWLPQSLLDDALRKAERLGDWSLGKKGNYPTLVLTQAGGTTFTGSFALPSGQKPQIKVECQPPPPASQPASRADVPAGPPPPPR